MKFRHLGYVATITLVFFVLFYRLGNPVIIIWDEAIYANNALEMSINHDFWVLRSNDAITLYNTKPPLVIWLQCLFIWLIGANEWAIRLPSAIASTLTCVCVFMFAQRVLKNELAGLFGVITLVLTYGFVGDHVARTGDLDGVLTCAITFYGLWSFFYLLKQPTNHKKHFVVIGLGILAAFFAKSVAGFMPLLGLFIGAILTGKIKQTLKQPFLYVVALSVLGFCVAYYLFREHLAAGYLDKVIFSEYRRFGENIMPWHEHPYNYYWTVMTEYKHFNYFLYLLPIALGAGLWLKQYRDFSVLNIAFCTSYLFLISYPSVKLGWYDAPLYPFLCLSIGLGWAILANKLNTLFDKKWLSISLVIIIFVSVCYLPFKQIVAKITETKREEALEKEGYYIRYLKENKPKLRHYTVLMPVIRPEHIDVANFYCRSYNHYEGYNLKLVTDTNLVTKGDTILYCLKEAEDYLHRNFNAIVLDSLDDCKLLVLQK